MENLITTKDLRENTSMKGNEIAQNIASLHLSASLGDKSNLKKMIENLPSQMLEAKDLLGRTPLILSVIHDRLDCVSLFLKSGVQVDNSDNSGQTALHLAINKGFYRCAKLLLSYNASWFQKDFAGVTSLHLAAIHPNPKCLSLILKDIKPGEIDIQDSSKKTALHWSTAYCNIEHVKILLNQGANPCIPDDEGKTPLHWAVTSNGTKVLDCIKVLLEKEVNLINWQDYEGRSALHLAVATCSAEVVHYLASLESCNIDILDNLFCTPLHWAAQRGMSDKVDILLKKRASHTSADSNGATPLHYAAHFNHVETVKMFLSRNYIQDVGDMEGRTAFIWASARNSDDAIQVMIKYGICLTTADKNGSTALHAAAIQGHVSTIKLLIEHGIPVDIIDNSGMSPFLKACELGRVKAAQVLLDHGADILALDNNHRSALHWCALGGHAYLCQILLHKGINSNLQDSHGMSPLHYGSLNGCINCVSVLLESKANLNINDNEGKTALHWAVLSDHVGVVKLLLEYDANVNAMALSDKWITPLDIALYRDNSEIINLLKQYKGLKAFEIEEIAAYKIQSWYRILKGKRKISKEIYDFKQENLSNIHLGNINSINSLRRKSHTLFKDNETKSTFISPSKIPIATWRLKNNRISAIETFCDRFASNSNVVTTNHVFLEDKLSIEDAAAVIVQKAWRRYTMKSRFRRMRDKLKIFFKANNSRKAAEREWNLKLEAFYSQF